MRNETELQAKLEEIRINLHLVQEKAKTEMDKPYNRRDYKLLKFLNREKNVWEYALLQMEWVLASE